MPDAEPTAPLPARPARTSRRSAQTTEAAKAVVPAAENALPTASLPTTLPTWRSRFAEAGPPLARFLPDVPPSQMGLRAEFCDLYIFLSHLHVQGWSGYLYAQSEVEGNGKQVWALLLRGRPIAAAAERHELSSSNTSKGSTVSQITRDTVTGQQALGELILTYQNGGSLAAYALPHEQVELLSGLGAAATQAFELTPTFNGVYAQPSGGVLYAHGEAVALLESQLPYEAAFAASNSPQPLMLPRHLAGWAHAAYIPTLRGRDVLSPITAAHSEFRAEFGQDLATALITALVQGQTPAEFALEHDTPLAEIEPWLSRFKEQGYLVR